ncbi:hypothetical protein BKA83DRAFT_4132482 [Pisolithus microcarpus]|nr:hypothetical protein BKA83DRAFT_4132482 [Pisolithus microcarpus]
MGFPLFGMSASGESPSLSVPVACPQEGVTEVLEKGLTAARHNNLTQPAWTSVQAEQGGCFGFHLKDPPHPTFVGSQSLDIFQGHQTDSGVTTKRVPHRLSLSDRPTDTQCYRDRGFPQMSLYSHNVITKVVGLDHRIVGI